MQEEQQLALGSAAWVGDRKQAAAAVAEEDTAPPWAYT